VLLGLDPRVLAGPLAHESAHVRADLDGRFAAERAALGPEAACHVDEYRAVETEVQVWLALFGPHGKEPVEHAYEDQMNVESQLYLKDPDGFRAYVAEEYAEACRDAPPPRRLPP
jgi:hypothetical protein